MARSCEVCGKGPVIGNSVTTRGKAKYLGGVGTKITGITARKFKPNIQKVRALIDGQVVRIKVSAKAIKMGLVTKPKRRTWKKPETAAAAFGLGSCFIDDEVAAARRLPVQGGDGFVSVFRVGHLHKTEPARATGVPIGHDTDAVYLPVRLEHLPQLFL